MFLSQPNKPLPLENWLMPAHKPLLFYNIRQIFTSIALVATALPAFAQVSGTVFRDFNANGTKDNSPTFNEPFVAGVTVTAYNAVGTPTVTTTDANGAYAFTGLGTPLRIEFSGLKAGDHTSKAGSANASSVQFYTAVSSTAHYAVNYPQDYAQVNPLVAIPSYINGNSQIGGSTQTTNALFVHAYNESNTTGRPYTINNVGNMAAAGAVWGTAYHKYSNKIFWASFAKRHVSYGNLGANGIYVTNNAKTASGGTATTAFVNLNAINPAFDANNVTRDFAPGMGDKTQANYDASIFDLVGKSGLGGLEVSEDGKYLYVLNLNDRKLWRIYIGTNATAPTAATDIVSYTALPTPCTGSTFRPFAIKVYRGDIYVGGICDGVNGTASNSPVSRNNLNATVYKVAATDTPSSATWTSVLDFPLTFNRFANLNNGETNGGQTAPYIDPNGTNATLSNTAWHPWARTFTDIQSTNANAPMYPQPMLTDIEFDYEGTMVLGFADRTGHQGGAINYGLSGFTTYYVTGAGDILRAYNNNGQFQLESNAKEGLASSKPSTAGVGNADGPNGGEFYYQDRYDAAGGVLGNTTDPSNHDETSVGGLAFWPGSGEILNTVFDPIQDYNSGGIRYYNNTTGVATKAIQYYEGYNIATFGKANGLGDVEVLADPAPLQLGNRIFADTDSDGIQDAGEAGINGITVELWLVGGAQVATASTAGDGNYYFDNSNVTMNGATSVLPNTAYEIRIPNISGGSKQAALGTNVLTAANAGSNDNIDSDATILGATAIISITTGNAGENNHSLDAGFKPAPLCVLTATATKANDLTCSTPTALLTANSTPTIGISYVWSNSATTQTITVNTAATYTVTLTEIATGCMTSATVTVIGSTAPPPCIPVTITRTK